MDLKTVYSLTNYDHVTRKQIMCYARYEKKTKNHQLEMAKKKLWRRIPHLMQQHMTPRRGDNFISLDIYTIYKCKRKRKKRAKRTTD